MRVGLLIAFAGRNCGGPEVFEREIVRAMTAAAPQHDYHLYCLDHRAPDVIDLAKHGVTYHLLQPSVRVLSMLTSLPRAISRTVPHVLHALLVPPVFTAANTIMCMPCSSLIRHPEFYPPLVRLRLRFLLHRAVPKAAKVICVSEHVREVVRETFQLPVEKLPVIYPGLSPLFRYVPEEEKRARLKSAYAIDYPYLLFSGRWEHRKNIIRTLEAFSVFKERYHTGHKLVFTGGRHWASTEAEQLIRRRRLDDVIVNLGKTSMDDLPYLYGGADALVFASLWEGFGMPVVEAMACGTPVITSNIAAMPETAGGAAVLVDPYSTEQIAEAMHRVVGDTFLRQRLREQGFERVKSFSWEATVAQMLKLYDEVAGQ